MAYTVEITEPAARNIEEAFEWLHAESPAAAERWIDGLLATIHTLTRLPLRCPVAPESDDFDETIREIFFGRYRILSRWRSAGSTSFM